MGLASNRPLRGLLLALLLAPAAARADRTVKVVYDATSTVAGTADSGNLGTIPCDQLLITVVAASAASGAVSLYQIDETKPTSCPGAGCILLGTVASVATATPDKSLSLGVSSAAPVPRFTRVIGVGGGAGTVRVRVECSTWR